ncbi:hypothetical protein JG688_00005870 [Phytophthora aleatoria]|uniref:Tc1-like transposase DDE domain-containing protein n=1 Tax=Phytophthora aleatoria TaxID=2496075 RepID=A0A8J5IZ84_9STRA|nr:hypothetical protein JG688_00005870 [Phytophthora aleatoria]
MDGASCHKNQTNPTPHSRALKAGIQAWLEEKEIWYDTSNTKAELMMVVRANKPKPIYRATEIASSYQHFVYYTPPYHPELQPIELIWDNIKDGIADVPASNMDAALGQN